MTKLTYEYTCGICGAQAGVSHLVAKGNPPPLPSPPHAWRDVFGVMVCANHKVTADLEISEHRDDDTVPRRPWRSGVLL